MSALLFPEPGHGAAQAVLPCSKMQKDRAADTKAKRKQPNACFEQSMHSAVVLRCLGVRYSAWLQNACPSRKSGFTGSATRKPSGGCYGQMNRHGKRIASLARIQSRFHATLYSFPERVRRISTGSLQPLQQGVL